MIWIQQHAELLFCLVGCMLVTVIPRVGPVMYLHAESLPDLLRHWLSFVPVAVMAALVGPDVFIYQGEFMPTHHNLILMTALPALLKLVFSPHREEALRRALAEMAGSLEFSVEPWPLDRA